MEKNEILKRVNETFIDILDEPELVLTETTNAAQVEGWDSLSHIQLVVAIEKGFKLKFTSREIQSWNNIGDMVDCINMKLSDH